MGAEELRWLSAVDLRERLVAGHLSVVESTRAFLETIERVDPGVHSFITIAHEAALEEAARLDAERARGEPLGPLFGVPVSIKDLFWTRGVRTTAGSLLFRDHVPDEDSVHAARVRGAGGVIVGKTNTPEFALFPRTVNRLGPEGLNPWDRDRSPGGSSGGAAASVALGLTPLAVASDGGGSTRIPAALCGTVGVYPSFGMVPKHGGFGGTVLFSSAGPIARTVRDAAVLLRVLMGHDWRDPSSRREPPPQLLPRIDDGVRGMRLRWIPSDESAGGDPRVADVARDAALRFGGLGATVEEGSEGFDPDRWMDSFYTIMHADRSASIGRWALEDPERAALLTDYARDHFERGARITGAAYSEALASRFRVIDWFERQFEQADLLLSPTVGIVAPRVDEPITRRPLVGNTFMVNFAGYAAATLPCGFVDGLPVGLQVIAQPGREPDLFRACRAFEQAFPWTGTQPPDA